MSPFRIASREWIQIDFDRSRYPVTVSPAPGVRFECPCCLYPTLAERGAYDICELCGWEDDGQDESDADRVLGGPNYELSLAAARENFKQHLEKHSPDSKRFRPPTQREASAKREIMAAFDALKRDHTHRENLWRQIVAAEQILREELEQRVRAIETASKQRG